MKSFKKLVSLTFYQRIVSLYPYVIYKRKSTNNVLMFKNYGKAIHKMTKIKKINQMLLNKPKCYVGIRESDITIHQEKFKESICLFNSDPKKQPCYLRLNQNIDNKNILPYYTNQLISFHKKYPECYFVFYNPSTAYKYPKEIIKNTICLNQQKILDLLNNKLFLKKWLDEHEIPVIKYETFLGKEILYSKLSHHFNHYTSFVIQQCHGGGGVGTFKVDCENVSKIIERLQPLQQYIVSPFLESISVNTHIFISSKQTILSPGSIQLVETKDSQLLYSGCDYIAYRDLDNIIREKIKNLSLKIANFLRKENYSGIAGIDFIIDKNQNVYCAEINPRFQASTMLIDMYLKEHVQAPLEATSTFEINEMAFNNTIISSLDYEDEINYSCFYYYNINKQYVHSKYELLKSLNVKVFEDGMNYYFDKNQLDQNSYMFKSVFTHAICKISPDYKLWINDNIIIDEAPHDIIKLKISLLNQGVRLEGNSDLIKKGTFESIDILLKPNHLTNKPIYINCAYNIHLSKYSPYVIKKTGNNEELYYYDQKLGDVVIEKNQLQNFTELEQNILYLATDRLRIKLIQGCENKNMGNGCKFCNLPISHTTFITEEIIAALDHVKKENIQFRHILIGGGANLSSYVWNQIMDISLYLKSDDFFSQKPIMLMSVLPPMDILQPLKNSGIDEVAFNMEIANENLALKLMPNKYNVGKIQYYDVFKCSIQIFGIGNVRTALLVGLDTTKELYDEVLTLAEMGVLPCLSAFRSLPNSEFENQLTPSNQYLIEVYTHISFLLEELQGPIQELGPQCIACRNNMLCI